MNKRRVILIGLMMVVSYPGVYVVLRLSKYFVRQEFSCLSCSESAMTRLKADYPAAQTISVESERSQIGCGRIQKGNRRVAEAFLGVVFAPLAEAEMRIRGFNQSTLYVFDTVLEAGGSEGGGPYPRQTLLAQFVITRAQQCN